MRTRQGWLGLVLRSGLVAAACAAFTQGASAKEYLVKFKTKSAFNAAAAQNTVAGLPILDTHKKLAKIDLPEGVNFDKARTLRRLMDRGDVDYVVPNATIYAFGEPNDPKFDEQWALSKVEAPAAWDESVGSRDVTVAVVDTGTDYTHPDLKANIWTNPNETLNGKDDDGNGLVDDVRGWDYKDNDNEPQDETSSRNPGHGTHCAGIVGSVGNNGEGISGMSQKVSLMPLRFIGPNGQGDLMGGIKSIDYAIENGADIISASWGAKIQPSQAQPLIEAVGRANDAGVIFVAAAANNGANNDTTPMYPANTDLPNVIAVAASNSSDQKPQWSNYGKATVDVASPGADILSTLPDGSYGELSGTSMATPLVAGMVALLKGQAEHFLGRELSGPEVRSIMQTTGADVDIETACMCRVDANAAMEAVTANQLTVVPAATTLTPQETAQISAIGGSGDYSFSAADTSIVEVSADGSVTAKAEGETTITVTDGDGNSAESLAYRVAKDSGGGGGNGECPFEDPMMCEMMCQIDPSLPWCD